MAQPTDPPAHRPQKRSAKRRSQGPRPAGVDLRHQARILALQSLYELDVTDHPLDEVLARAADDPLIEETDTLPSLDRAALAAHIERLVRGALADQTRIDAAIAEAAPAFPVPQLPSVDRNVLRLAMYELLHEPQVPVKAAINEAVELAKRFGGDSSSRFVNGVLGTIAQTLPRAGAAPRNAQDGTPSADADAPSSPTGDDTDAPHKE